MDRHIANAMMVAIVASLAATAGAAELDPNLAIVDEGQLGASWSVAEGATIAAPGYPQQFADTGREVCMAFGYLVNPDGTTTDYKVLTQWNSLTGSNEPEFGFWDAFSQSAAQAVSQWKFQPREGVTPEATYTVATLGWQSGAAGDPAAVRARCKVDDLATVLRGDRRTGLNDHLIDREYRAENRYLSRAVETPRTFTTSTSQSSPPATASSRPVMGRDQP